MWLDQTAGADESEYLLASQARTLMEKIDRDLQTADIDLPRRYPSGGSPYLPVFAAVTDTILAALDPPQPPEAR
jgi:hypothetical protein